MLQLRGTSLPDCQKLIAEMLDKRDQWGRVLSASRRQIGREYGHSSKRHCAGLTSRPSKKHKLCLPDTPASARELLDVLSQASRNVDPDSPLTALTHVTHMRHLTDHAHWKAYAISC